MCSFMRIAPLVCIIHLCFIHTIEVERLRSSLGVSVSWKHKQQWHPEKEKVVVNNAGASSWSEKCRKWRCWCKKRALQSLKAQWRNLNFIHYNIIDCQTRMLIPASTDEVTLDHNHMQICPVLSTALWMFLLWYYLSVITAMPPGATQQNWYGWATVSGRVQFSKPLYG